MEVVEKFLCDLQSSVEDKGVGVEPYMVVNNIESYLSDKSSFSKNELELSVGVLLSSRNPPNIMLFLVDNILSKDRRIIKAKVHSLKLLAGLVALLL